MIEASKGEGGLLWYWVAILSLFLIFLVYQYIISPVKVFFLGDSYYYL